MKINQWLQKSWKNIKLKNGILKQTDSRENNKRKAFWLLITHAFIFLGGLGKRENIHVILPQKHVNAEATQTFSTLISLYCMFENK